MVLGLHKIGSLELNPPEPHPGFGFSRELVADVGFRSFPIDESRRSIGDALTALIQNAFMPGRRFYGFRGAGEIFPQRLHRGKFFMETHVFERKAELHGRSIPQRWIDSNPPWGSVHKGWIETRQVSMQSE